jgi:hypothetical protein
MSKQDEQEDLNHMEEKVGTRRRFFGLAAAGVAGLFAGRLTTEDAHAADGDPISAGQTTTALGKTELSTTGPVANDAALAVNAPNADYGVKGTAAAIGVYGRGPIGVLGEGAVGGVFSGTDTAVSLTPTGTSGPSTTQSLKGDVLVDKDGVMWFCIADGTPGTWIKLSHGGVRYLDAPDRVYSSTNPGAGGTHKKGEVRPIQITGSVPGLPDNAVGIVGNVTVHQTVAAGFVTVYPAGADVPAASTLNWFTPNMQAANAISVRLGAQGRISVYADGAMAAGANACEVIVDVSGYVL